MAGARRRLGPQSGRTDLHAAIDTEGRTERPPRATSTTSTATGTRCATEVARTRRPHPVGAVGRRRRRGRAALRHAERDPAGLTDERRLALLHADGAELERAAALADDLRRDAVGDDVTYVVNRNINFTNVCYTGCRFCAFAQRRTDADAYTLSLDRSATAPRRRGRLGATEVCMQGGIHPDLPGTAYFDIAARGEARACPDMHVHAFSPMEVVNGAARTGLSIRDWLIEAQGGRRSTPSPAPRPRSSTTTCAGC